MDPDRRPERGHAAGERLDHREAEALVLRRDQHRVGGVDPVRHLVGRHAAQRQQRHVAGRLPRAVEPLQRARRVVREEQVRAGRVEAEARARLRARDRAGSARGDPDREHGDAAAVPAPGRLRLNARETAAGSAVNGSAARVTRRERRTNRSLPCSVTTTGPRRAASAGQGGEAEVGVHDVEALAARSRRADRRRRPQAARAGRAGTRTPRPRRRRAGAAPRPGRATKIPRCGAAAVGHMLVTTSARTAERTSVTNSAHSVTNARRAVSRGPRASPQAPPTDGGRRRRSREVGWRRSTSGRAGARGARGLRARRRGQGTVEYVGLILLVAVILAGVVKASGGAQGLHDRRGRRQEAQGRDRLGRREGK